MATAAGRAAGEPAAAVHVHLCYTGLGRGRWLDLYPAWDRTHPDTPERRSVTDEIRSEAHASSSAWRRPPAT
ncbi:hypothetical protein ACFO4E_18680 [Nocardiopsis mangrovi]|uniref:Uncharacterized protein n=1 Tax=Nocardiopsis mangrovi TaxID=1179818 RepID=A0ABV9DYE5_9ACTN